MSGTAHAHPTPAEEPGPEGDISAISTAPDRATAARVQRRTVRVLMSTQIVAGIGIGSTLSSASLLVGRLTGSDAVAGLSTTSATLGAAVLGIPLAALSTSRGRRYGLGGGWLIAAAGALLVLIAARLGWAPLVLVGTLLLGAGTAANLQSRFAAADLAEDAHRGRALSLVVWSTTVGSVIGPNLTGPGEPVARALGLPEEAGTFVFSLAAFLCGGALTWFCLRPDPLHLAAALARAHSRDPGPALRTAAPTARFTTRFAAALGHVRASPSALLGLVTVVLGHAVMVSVMTMTPVHLSHHGAALSVVGFTISLHIAGMYALSPLVGRLTDRIGRVPMILVGQAVYGCAAIVAGTAGNAHWATVTGLFLLGLGWSCATIAGSTLLTESIPAGEGSEVQGLADTLMNLAGAAGGAVAGGIVTLIGYGGLNAAAAALILPVLALALAPRTRARA